jgi:hypothetical protein
VVEPVEHSVTPPDDTSTAAFLRTGYSKCVLVGFALIPGIRYLLCQVTILSRDPSEPSPELI